MCPIACAISNGTQSVTRRVLSPTISSVLRELRSRSRRLRRRVSRIARIPYRRGLIVAVDEREFNFLVLVPRLKQTVILHVRLRGVGVPLGVKGYVGSAAISHSQAQSFLSARRIDLLEQVRMHDDIDPLAHLPIACCDRRRTAESAAGGASARCVVAGIASPLGPFERLPM
jgi:hypothetical protein